jgi:hypothetical protein
MANPSPALPKTRYFSVEEANKMLPLVSSIVRDVVDQLRVVNDLRQRLSGVGSGKSRQTDVYSEELAQSQAERETEEAKLTSYVEELTKLGVELKGPDGLCDFPAMIDGREVCLCWRLGETEVRYWHEVHAGFAGRKPLPVLAG